ARPSTHRAPLYPAALATGYFFKRDIVSVTFWVNCIVSALTCVALYVAVVPLLGDRSQLAFMLPVVFFPLSIYYCASSYSDTFVTFTVVVYIWTLLWLMAQPTSTKA